MKRIKYYVIHCTIEERDLGQEHYEVFNTQEKAIERAKQINNDEFISVEKHQEIWTRHDWLPDWENTNWCQIIEIN